MVNQPEGYGSARYGIDKLRERIRKEWLSNLSDFIVIANRKTWAGAGAEVDPRRPGYIRLQWPYPDEKMTPEDRKDYEGWENWRLEDEFTGFLRAPGTTTVYYKGKPAWVMQYGGHGQTEGHEDKAPQTFEFLKRALIQVDNKLPIRGPKEYAEGNSRYEFVMLEGDMTDGLWRERITEGGVQTFTQTGMVGIVIDRNEDKLPVPPWSIR